MVAFDFVNKNGGFDIKLGIIFTEKYFMSHNIKISCLVLFVPKSHKLENEEVARPDSRLGFITTNKGDVRMNHFKLDGDS